MSDQASAVGHAIAEELAKCDVRLVASLPYNWLTSLINAIDGDTRFVHVRVNREEAAVGLCSGAYLGALGSAALMGASGFMTVVYAITKINYTYEIPLFLQSLVPTYKMAARHHSLSQDESVLYCWA